MPDLTIEDINKAVKDSAYAAVGFGVLGFQRAQVRRRELIEQLQSASDRTAVTDQLQQLAKLVEEQLDPAREQLVSYVKQLEEQIDPAREQFVTYARKADAQVAPVRRQFDSTIDELEQRLPASTRNTFSSLRRSVHATEDRFRSVVGLETPASAAYAKAGTRKAS